MDFMQIIDLFLHVDKYLEMAIAQYGNLVYLILFAIVFCETGLVVLPFLPGDTLLFIGGALCAAGATAAAQASPGVEPVVLNVWLLMALLITAAVAGNTVNYWVGKAIGQKVFTHNYRWLDQAALKKTQGFYERHGGKTIILSRFVPVVRTFAPFVAGVSAMHFGRFQSYNISGALLWVVGLVTAGYFFGHIPVVRDHLTVIVLVGVGAAVVPVVVGAGWKLVKRARG